MRHRLLNLVTWLLSRLVRKDQRDALMGDLAEEHALRSKATSSSAALKWHVQQVCASLPPLLWARVRQPEWLATLGLALVAYIAVGVAELTVNRLISYATGTTGYNPLTLCISFPMVVLIGYCAARLRRGAAAALAAMMLVAVTVMMVSTHESTPLWFRIAYFVAGPAAAFIGGTLYSRRRACS